jgi:hypothetical protein
VHTVEVQNRNPTELSHRDGEIDIDHAVHGCAPDGNREVEAIAHRKSDVDLFGVEGDSARHKRNLVESVSAPGPPSDADLEARLLPGNCSAGFEPALIQAVFTPMVAGFGRLYGMPAASTWIDTL